MKWARILVKTTGSPRPSTINILEGPRSFELQIWWEVRPWVTDVYLVYARAAAKSPKEEDDGEARAEKRVGIVCPSCNDDRQKEMAGEPDTGGQTSLVEADWGKVGAAHLLKRIGGDQGDWVREKVGTSSLGGGLVQRVAIGPTDRAGFRNGLKGPQLFGPKSGPDRRIKTQNVMGEIKLRKEGQQTSVHNKACLGRSGPALIGPNQSENVSGGGVLQLERWNPYSGCIRRKGSAQEEWVRVVGLPLHLWKTEVLKKIGDACGGFLAIDKITELRREMKWARILVKTTGSPRPSTINILEGSRSFELQIWWEVRPWVTDVYPVYARAAAKSPKEEDDGEARAEKRVGIVCPSCNDDRQKEMAGELDTGGQTGLVEADWGKVGAAHLLKLRGGDQGDWVREKVGTSSLGGGLVQRVAIGPTDRAGFRNGLKGPQLFGPKSGPDRRI